MIFEARDFSVSSSNGRPLFKKVDFEIQKGSVFWIRGANGIGKTTFLKAMLGLYPNISGPIAKNILDTEIEYVPQQSNLQFFFPLTLRDVIRLTTQKKDSIRLLRENEKSRLWNTASGGEKQKTLLTRALLTDKPVLIVDEPFNHLDTTSKMKVEKALETQVQNGCTLILVSHEPVSFKIDSQLLLESYA